MSNPNGHMVWFPLSSSYNPHDNVILLGRCSHNPALAEEDSLVTIYIMNHDLAARVPVEEIRWRKPDEGKRIQYQFDKD